MSYLSNNEDLIIEEEIFDITDENYVDYLNLKYDLDYKFEDINFKDNIFTLSYDLNNENLNFKFVFNDFFTIEIDELDNEKINEFIKKINNILEEENIVKLEDCIKILIKELDIFEEEYCDSSCDIEDIFNNDLDNDLDNDSDNDSDNDPGNDSGNDSGNDLKLNAIRLYGLDIFEHSNIINNIIKEYEFININTNNIYIETINYDITNLKIELYEFDKNMILNNLIEDENNDIGSISFTLNLIIKLLPKKVYLLNINEPYFNILDSILEDNILIDNNLNTIIQYINEKLNNTDVKIIDNNNNLFNFIHKLKQLIHINSDELSIQSSIIYTLKYILDLDYIENSKDLQYCLEKLKNHKNNLINNIVQQINNILNI